MASGPGTSLLVPTSSRARRTLDLLTRSSLPVFLFLAVILGVYLASLEVDINGNDGAYGTDVGEIQNALPRWGTIHGNGYPLYMLAGSILVTGLRGVGVSPAAGASFYSTVAAVLCLALLVAVSRELGAPPHAATGGACVVALSTSFWMNAVVAEVHAFTLALTAATLLFALRFFRSGETRDLLGLTLAFTQGVAHQQAVALLMPCLLVLVLPKWRLVWSSFPKVILVAAAAPAAYLYLPLRQWMGADWLFGSPGTWKGFLAILFDTKAGRVTRWPGAVNEWLTRGRQVADLLGSDLPIILLALGLVGVLLLMLDSQKQSALALTLAWIPYFALSLVIWEGRVSDALLAAKMPVVFVAGLGLAITASRIERAVASRRPTLAPATAVSLLAVFLLACLYLYIVHVSTVVAVTRDRSAEEPIAIADRIKPTAGQPRTLVSLWGRDFWALAYAQAYRGQLKGLRVVDHNADLTGIAQSEGGLLILSRMLELRPLAFWDGVLGRAYLASPFPDVIALKTSPTISDPKAAKAGFDLGNGVLILSEEVSAQDGALMLSLQWLASRKLSSDFHVAVHLLARNPPLDASDVLAQADRTHPVSGSYPTSRWEPGEVVTDSYLVPVPPGAKPVALRVAMYQQTPDGKFENSKWLVVPLAP